LSSPVIVYVVVKLGLIALFVLLPIELLFILYVFAPFIVNVEFCLLQINYFGYLNISKISN